MRNEDTQKALERFALSVTRWVGSPASIIGHTIFFVVCFVPIYFGTRLDDVLLFLTTAVSLEAVYLAILVQLTVNMNTRGLFQVGKDIDEIQEDIDEIQKDVDEMQVDIDEIEEEDKKESIHTKETDQTLEKIEVALQKLLSQIDELRKR